MICSFRKLKKPKIILCINKKIGLGITLYKSMRPFWRSLMPSDSLRIFCLLAAIVLCCSLIGIWTRPLSHLAFFWPANAVLISLMLRYPQLNRPAAWLGAVIGYIFADLLTGSDLRVALTLTTANLITIFVVLALIYLYRVDYRHYGKGFTFLKLSAVCALGSIASASFAVLMLPLVSNEFMSVDRMALDFGTWWSGEVINCILVMPIILAFPPLKKIRYFFYNRRQIHWRLQRVLPIIALIVSIGFAHLFPGPGAMLYPLAALIWAALVYKFFTITVINLIIAFATYQSLSDFIFDSSTDTYLISAISIRIGLSMLVLTPLIVCIISRNRQKIFKNMLYLANHDSLTHTINRRFFFEAAENFLSHSPKASFALMMLDIDHFKKINDNHGHHVGDYALQHFAEIVKKNMREQDLFARIGGEEFIVLLRNTQELEAVDIAERIRKNIEQNPLQVSATQHIALTVSIGLTFNNHATAQHLKDYMVTADHALYSAKSSGRNRVMVAS